MSQLLMTASPTFVDVPDTSIAIDKVLTDDLIKKISNNAKYGAVRLEIIQMGFYKSGDVIVIPVSPVDGYVYAASEVSFNFQLYSTRGIGAGFVSGQINPPPAIAVGQAGNLFWFTSDVDSAQTVQLHMAYADGTGSTTDGMVKVTAICQRNAALTMTTVPTFVDGQEDVFAVAQPLRVGNQSSRFGLMDVSHNAKFGVTRHEIIYKGFWAAGATVPPPVSPIDGYTYDNHEIIWKLVMYSNLASAGTFANGQTTVPTLGNGQLSRHGAGKGPLYWWLTDINSVGVIASFISYYVQGGAETIYTNTDGILKVYALCQRGSTQF